MNGAMRDGLVIACLAAPLAASCFSPNSVICADGTTICPPGNRCDDKNRCISGSGWSPTTFFNTELSGVWASGPDDAYAVGPGLFSNISSVATISHWDGTRWAAVGPGGDLGLPSAVWGSGPKDVFVVGSSDAAYQDVIHWDGTVWSKSTAPADLLAGVWGSGPHDVLAVSLLVTLDQWNGSTWSAALTAPDLSPVGFSLTGVWTSGPHDVFIVGDRDIGRWDGASLSTARITGHHFFGVWGSGPHDVFAVGDGGMIVHWDGARWSTMASGTTATLRAVSGSGPGDVFAGGDGILLHLKGGVWERVYPPGLTSISGLSVTPSRVFVVGFEGEVHLDRPGATGAAGSGGTGGAGGTAGGGGAAGAGGAGGDGGPELRPENLISDFEQADGATVVMVGDPTRNGAWFTYNDDNPRGTDPSCVQTPPAMSQTSNGQWVPYGGEAPPGGPRPGSTGLLALHGWWTGCTVWGAGVGASLNFTGNPDAGTSASVLPYDVTPFAGVTFWARAGAGSDTALRIKLTMTDETEVQYGGLCVAGPSNMCNDDWGERFDLPPDGTWKQFTIRWSDPDFHQEGWGAVFPWDPRHVLDIMIQSAVPGVTYDFWIDDMYFFN